MEQKKIIKDALQEYNKLCDPKDRVKIREF
jgi:hypothetical protein